jgi:hypothetical protein
MTTLTTPIYPGDAIALEKLSADQRVAFEKWMQDLDKAHIRAGSPYGKNSLWRATGAECWLSWFLDGDDPADALAEDLSNAD